MKKRFVLGLVLIVLIGFMCGCRKEASEFKESYEALNGQTNKSGKEHRTINIDKNNPFIKVSAEEIVKKIENKETFVVYFGDELCPWCRSVIEKFIEVAKKYKIKDVYYVKIWDSEGNEVLRDKYSLNEDGTIKEDIKGTDAYKKLLEYFSGVLDDYELTNSNDIKVPVGEKRIFAPNFMYVKDGEAVSKVTGISELQKDSREELTKEILEEEEDIFDIFFSNMID